MDEFAKHEFLDRTYIIETLFDKYILNHIAIKETPDYFQSLAEHIAEKLAELYQEAGNL